MKTSIRPRLRSLTSTDAPRILDLTRSTGVFRDEEMQVAEEVLEAAATAQVQALDRADAGGLPYYTLGAELDGRLVGWICWGRTPCTEGTWDLYWLAVDPAVHGRGVGSTLVEAMEQWLRGRARLISVDTSGRADYRPTRAFYEALGYRAVAVVPDFYAPGDDQVIFTKSLA
ncbi:MAG TPA: GNAT family N-acetyltransferase [Gemmatimonadales bacterium]|nr:GNAT family N-acetyltransferase [Gemmatimonadales bacterium]